MGQQKFAFRAVLTSLVKFEVVAFVNRRLLWDKGFIGPKTASASYAQGSQLVEHQE